MEGRHDMNHSRLRRPTPAFVVAMIALFVALGGTAGAVATQAVPLAKRALSADNSKKLGGQTSAQIVSKAAQSPGPASTAAGVVTTKTLPMGQLGPDQGRLVTISCDPGGKILGGGFSSDGPVFNFDSYPSGDATWSLYLVNPDETAPHSVTLYGTCIK
jgi:hypothetical protein